MNTGDTQNSEKHLNRHVNLVGALTGFSRLLGLFREMLTSRLMGATLEQSAFVFAFMIPNMFRRLFGEGALSAAFVPVFKDALHTETRAEAERLARSVASILALILLSLVVAGIAAATLALPFFAPDGETGVTLRLLRIMLPYAFFICMAALGMGVLNALGKFGGAAFAPALLNIVWIAALGALMFFPQLTVLQKVTVIAWVVLVAGFLQFAFLAYAAHRRGITLTFTLNGWRTERVVRVWRHAIPAALGAGAVQINLVIDNGLAFWVSEDAPSFISYAERLVYLPLGVVATAFATVLLPTLAGAFSGTRVADAKAMVLRAAEDVFILMLPAALGLALLAPDIVRIVYEGGIFTREDTVYTARALLCYAPGLLVFSMNKILTPWFYAQQDTKTPLRIGLVSVVANIALSLTFVLALPAGWKHAGIAAATVLCSFGTCVALAVIASRRNGTFGWAQRLPFAARVAGSGALMCVAVLLTRHALTHLHAPVLLTLCATIAVALVTYGIAASRLCHASFKRVLALKK